MLGLRVEYHAATGPPLVAVDGVSFTVAAGETVGLLGESGCGKTSIARAVLGLLPANGAVSGVVRFRGELLDDRRREELRGAGIGLVVQEPGPALHPTRRVGSQILEVLRAHRVVSRQHRRAEAVALLTEVGLAEDVFDAYPHQLSGGQQQRVAIGLALAGRPALVLADEPTAALDTATGLQVLDLLVELKCRRGTAFLHISHEPQVLASIADRLLVMYAGKLVEAGPAVAVLKRPLHPYTDALMQCLPPLPGEAAPATGELPELSGNTAGRAGKEPGCRFASRCPDRRPICELEDPAARFPESERCVWCVKYGP